MTSPSGLSDLLSLSMTRPSEAEDNHHASETCPETEECRSPPPFSRDRIKLIFDNINYIMKVSRMNKLNKSKTKNMIHVIGIENVIPSEGLEPKEAQNLVRLVMQLVDMVPSGEQEKESLKRDFAIYISRILQARFKNMFQEMKLDSFVTTHIDHKFSESSATKSKLVMID